MTIPALDVLREWAPCANPKVPCRNKAYLDREKWCPRCAALADLEALVEAAVKRRARGHDDTCGWSLDRSAGDQLMGYPCSCGHESLDAALVRVLGEQQP